MPASVRPGPVSGVAGKRNGTPCPNALARLQTGPSERSPAAYQTSSASRSVSIASAPSMWKITPSASPARQASRSAVSRTSRIAPSHARSSRCRRAPSAPTVRAASSHGTLGW